MDPLHFKKMPCRVCGRSMMAFNEEENPICVDCWKEQYYGIIISECPTIEELKKELDNVKERTKTIPNMPELEDVK